MSTTTAGEGEAGRDVPHVGQVPGCLPEGYGLDSLLTPKQFAVWRQITVGTVRARLPTMPGVVAESRLDLRVHPRSYLDGRLARRAAGGGR